MPKSPLASLQTVSALDKPRSQRLTSRPLLVDGSNIIPKRAEHSPGSPFADVASDLFRDQAEMNRRTAGPEYANFKDGHKTICPGACTHRSSLISSEDELKIEVFHG